MKNTWRISKLDKHLKLSRIVLVKSKLIKIGKKKLLMNGIRLLNLRAKKLKHHKMLSNKINAVCIHTVSIFLLLIY